MQPGRAVPKEPYKGYYFSKDKLDGAISIFNIKAGDYTIIGTPKEGYGFSNDDAKPRGFSPLKFEDCKFTIKSSGTTEITIHIRDRCK